MKIHWRKSDDRIKSLELIVSSLKSSIKELEEDIHNIHWYDGLWFLEESEPIIGLIFIALQNYINSSIYDCFDAIDNKIEKYKLGDKLNQKPPLNTISEIELIITVANYYKHRDDNTSLHRGTASNLNKIGLKFGEEIEIENSPIFKSLELLNADDNFDSLIEIVVKWRKLLWEEIT